MSEITTTAPPPPTDEELEQQLQTVVVDVSDAVISNATDHAEEVISEETTQRGVRGFIKRIWKGNITRDFVRINETQKGREEIVESGNIYALAGGTEEDHNTAMGAVVQRFTDEYIHDGETVKEMSDIENGSTLQDSINTLIKEFASGDIDHDALVEEKTRLLAEFGKGVHKEERNKGLLYADNIVEVATNAKLAVEHGVAIDRIDALLSTKAGEARMGVRTEAKLQATDRVLDKLYNTKVGSLVNETTLAVAAGVAISAGRFVTNKAATAAGAVLGMGVGAGVVAGLRERLRVGQERTAHLRQRAEGGEAPSAGSKKREKLETTRYDTVQASEVLGTLQAARDILASSDAGDWQQAISGIRESQARVQLSDQKSIDLIRFSDKTEVENERLEIDISLAEAKNALKTFLENATDDELASAGLESRDVNDVVDDHAAQVSEILEDISQKDQVFNKLRRNRTMTMAACGFVSSVTVGTAMQELKAAMSSDLQGVFESNEDGQQRRTLLAGIFRDHQANTSGDLIGATDHANVLTEQAHAQLPPGFQLEPGSDGNWQLLDANGNSVSDNVTLDSNGHLSEASQDALTNNGYRLSEATETYETTRTVTETVPRTPGEYINAHQDEFTRVHRGWYDNDTPGVFDRNELRMEWGGQGGIDENGNYVFNVQSMTPDGSFHAGVSVDAQQLIGENKMVVALSMDRGTQSQVFMVPIDANGNAIIDRNSFMGQSLFENRDGHAHFTGGYAEAAQVLDVGPDGKTNINMLATVVGENNPGSGQDTITNIVTEQHERIITSIEAPVLQDVTVEVPFVMPVYGRRGLEKLPTEAEVSNPGLSPTYYGGRSLEELREWLKNSPELLHTRTRTVESDGTVSWKEADGSDVVRSIDRERDVLQSYLDGQRATNPEHMGLVDRVASSMPPMTKQTRVSINVPAWMEEDNLPGLLEQYTAQEAKDGTPLAPELYEINVLVNRKTGDEPDKSVEVIEKFITDFEAKHGFKPKVNFYDIEIDPPYNNVGYARKLLTDAVVLRSLNRPEQDGPLYFETEDADLVNVDPLTVNNIIDKMDDNPELDAVRGVQDRTPEYLKENDYLFVRRRAMDFFEILARAKRFRDPSNPSWNFTWNRIVTGGWNTAYTAESYALIGGYDVVVAGEDMSIGEKITMIRGDGKLPNLEVVGKVSTRTDSSPRRYIHEVLTDEPAYNDFSNEEANKIIRERSIEDALKAISKFERLDDTNKESFGNFVNAVFHWFQSATPSNSEAQQLTKRMLFFLGFKKDDYELSDTGLQINSWVNLQKALKGYRARYNPDLGRAPIAT